MPPFLLWMSQYSMPAGTVCRQCTARPGTWSHCTTRQLPATWLMVPRASAVHPESQPVSMEVLALYQNTKLLLLICLATSKPCCPSMSNYSEHLGDILHRRRFACLPMISYYIFLSFRREARLLAEAAAAGRLRVAAGVWRVHAQPRRLRGHPGDGLGHWLRAGAYQTRRFCRQRCSTNYIPCKEKYNVSSMSTGRDIRSTV